MKKYTLLLTFLLTALVALNGCTVAIISEDENIQDEKEAFAVEEKQSEEIETPDDVSVVEDESEEISEETVILSGLSHEYIIESDEGEVLAPDGEVLATYSYSYPVFISNEGDDEECIEAINQMFKENAIGDTFVSKEEFEFLLDEYLYAKDNDWHWFGPYDHSYNFELHTDAKGIISITEIWYAYTGGAHGNAAKESHTFDVVSGKELMLSDLLYGTDEEITEAFTQKFSEIKDAFFDDPAVVVPEEFPSAQYYVDADGVTAYFQQYQVGSYASGFVSATISDKEMLKFDFSDTTEQ